MEEPVATPLVRDTSRGETQVGTPSTKTPPIKRGVKRGLSYSIDSDETTDRGKWELTRNLMKEYDLCRTPSMQIEFINKNVLPYAPFNQLTAIHPLIVDSILIYGISPKSNDFLDFVLKLDIKMTAKSYLPQMTYVYNSYKNNNIDLKNCEVLFNPTLYRGRNINEFRYTLNCFCLLPKQAGNYLKDTSKVNLTMFLKGGKDLATSPIKAAGIDGREGDTIFNVIEEWAKDNEIPPEERIATKRAGNAKEVKSDNSTGSDSTTEWSYEYFKAILEKIFSSTKGYTFGLSGKNEYLERLYSVFKLPSLTFDKSSRNIIKNKSTAGLKDADVKRFGNPQIVDNPIYIRVQNGNEEIKGVYLFHKFVDMSSPIQQYYQKQAKKSLGTLKRNISEISPSNPSDVKEFYQSILMAIEKLPKLYRK